MVIETSIPIDQIIDSIVRLESMLELLKADLRRCQQKKK